jgi:hypothetical protein
VSNLAPSGYEDFAVSGVGEGDIAHLVGVHFGQYGSHEYPWKVCYLHLGQIAHEGFGLAMIQSFDNPGVGA